MRKTLTFSVLFRIIYYGISFEEPKIHPVANCSASIGIHLYMRVWPLIIRYICFTSELAVDIDIGLLSFSRVSESDEFVSETIALGAL